MEHDSPQGAGDLRELGELVQVAPRLRQHHLHGHALREGVEVDSELADVHLVVHHALSIDGHDGHANEQVKGVGGVVCPAGFPDAKRALIAKLPPETDQQPAMAEEQAKAVLNFIKVKVQPRGEQFEQCPQKILLEREGEWECLRSVSHDN